MSASALMPLLAVVLLIAVALVFFLPMLRARSEGGSSADSQGGDAMMDRLDERNWVLGVFYYNPADPNAFVPKRYGLGWTINFGHPGGKVIAGLMIIMILLPIALAILAPDLNATSGCHPGNCHLLP